MSKWISIDELIEFCDTERSMLNAHNGGNSVACAALRRVVDFVKEYAVETEPNKDWISVYDRLPELYVDVLIFTEGGTIAVDRLERIMSWGEDFYNYGQNVTYWMPLPEKPKSEGDAE